MKITFQHTDLNGRAGSTIICAGTSDGPSDMSIDGEGLLQLVQFPRAAEIKPFGRGNKQTTVAFGINRTFSTLVSAELYSVDLHAVEGLDGILRMDMGSQFGGLAGQRLLTCGCQRARSHLEGVTVFAQFVFVGGALRAF